MAEANFTDLLLEDPPKSDAKRQKLIVCVLTGNSKQYLGKVYTEERINELSAEEVDNLFGTYEVKLSGQMVKSLEKSIIKMYSMETCAVSEMSNQDTLSKGLESDSFLNSALQRFMCELYHRFSSFPALLSIGIIMSWHYLSERNVTGTKNGETNRDDKTEERDERTAGNPR